MHAGGGDQARHDGQGTGSAGVIPTAIESGRGHGGSAHGGTAHGGSGHGGSGHGGTGHTGSGHTGSGHTGSGHTGSGHGGTGHTGSGHTGSGHTGSGHTGSGHGGAGHTGSGQGGSGTGPTAQSASAPPKTPPPATNGGHGTGHTGGHGSNAPPSPPSRPQHSNGPIAHSRPPIPSTPTPLPVATAPQPSVAPAPASRPAPATQRERRTPTGHNHPAAPPPAAPGPRGAASAPGAGAAPVRPSVTPAAPRPRSARPGGARRHPAAGSSTPHSPITRIVTRVLGVVPRQVWAVLGLLAALGLALGATAGTQTLRARRLERQRRRLVADVGLLQSAILPELPERVGGARVSAAYRPAEGLAAGGDFYDAFELPGDGTAIVVGDVTGHGRDVVPLTALIRYSLRAYLEAGLGPRHALRVASEVLAPQLGGRLVTIAAAVFSPGRGLLTYATAGHFPPILTGVPGSQITACSSPPLGAGAPTGRRQTTVSFGAGAAACFYTDGVLDARVGSGRFGPDRLAAAFREADPHGPATDLLHAIEQHTDAQPDDMVACLLRPLPPAIAGLERVEELELDAAELAQGRGHRFLTACGLDPDQAEHVLVDAQATARRAGTVVIAVRRDQHRGVAVNLLEPPAVALPVRQPPAAGSVAVPAA